MTGNQEIFQKLMNQGHSAAWDQNWEQAAQVYRQALVEIPDHPNGLTNLGLALSQLQKYDESLDCYLRAAKITPSDPIPLERIASIYERQGKISETIQVTLHAAELFLRNQDVDKAIECWVHVTSLQPENQAPYARLALIYEKMGRRAESVSEYLALASLLQRAGDVVRTNQVIDHALQVMPESLEAQQAKVLARNKQLLPKPVRARGGSGPLRGGARPAQPIEEPAEKQLDPVTEARQAALVQLAALLFDQAEEPDVAPANRRGISSLARGTGGLSLGPSERTRIVMHIGQAIDSQSMGDESQAVAELERALEAGLSHPAAYFDLGLLTRTKDSQKSWEYLRKAARSPAFALAAHLLISQILSQNNRYRDAAVSALQALRLADAAIVPAEQADEVQQLYEPVIEAQSQRSEEELRKLVAAVMEQVLRPGWRQHLKTARAQLLAQSGQGALMPLAEMLLETGSSQVVETMAFIRQLAAQNKTRSAMEESFYALQQAPTYLPLHVQMGELLLQEGDEDGAVEKFKLVAELYNLRGESPQAARLMTRITQIAPMDMTTRNRLCDLLLAQGNVDEAIQQNINLAEIHYQLADLGQARIAFNNALRLAQQYKTVRAWGIEILSRIADIDLQQLDWRQALRAFEQIRAIDPENAHARYNLVSLNLRLAQTSAALSEADQYMALLEKTGRQKQAADFLTGLVDENPGMLELRKRLVDLSIRAGQVPQAVAQMDAIADKLLSSGNRTGAAAVLQAIINLNPPNVADYQAALAKIQAK